MTRSVNFHLDQKPCLFVAFWLPWISKLLLRVRGLLRARSWAIPSARPAIRSLDSRCDGFDALRKGGSTLSGLWCRSSPLRIDHLASLDPKKSKVNFEGSLLGGAWTAKISKNFQVMMDYIYLFEPVLAAPLKAQIVATVTTILRAQRYYQDNYYH